MTWYEKHSGGFRAKWRDKGRQVPGPTFPTEAEAKAWAIAKGHDVAAAMTMDAVLKHWASVRLAEKNASKEYITELVERITLLCAQRRWISVQDITLESFAQWRIDTDNVGVERTMSYLLSVLRWAAQWMSAPVAPKVLLYRRPRVKVSRVAKAKLTDADIAQILDRAASKGPQIHALIHYLISYGARPKTACILRIKDVDLKGAELRLHAKHSGKWEHALMAETVRLFALICAGRNPKEPLFLDQRPVTKHRDRARPLAAQPRGAWPLGRRGDAACLGGFYRRAFGHYLPHDRQTIYHLKYYAASRFDRLGIGLATMAEFMGHLDPANLSPYIRGSNEDQRAALAKIERDNERIQKRDDI
jgi:integrase